MSSAYIKERFPKIQVLVSVFLGGWLMLHPSAYTLADETPPSGNSTVVGASVTSETEFVEGTYIVNAGRQTPGWSKRAAKAVRAAGADVLVVWPEIGVVTAQLRSSSQLRAISASSAVESVGKIGERGSQNETAPTKDSSPALSTEIPNSEEDLWNLSAINAKNSDSRSGEGALVGVADSGIDARHPDLIDAIDEKKSVDCSHGGVADSSSKRALTDTMGHGTSVAGIIAASKNQWGARGVAPGAKLASLKVIDESNTVSSANLVCALVWSANQDIDVLNMSIAVDPWIFWGPESAGFEASNTAIQRAIKFAHSRNTLLVASGGNEGADLDYVSSSTGKNRWPVSFDEVIGVGAVSEDLSPIDFSNYGNRDIDISAPGEWILAPFPLASGTPFVPQSGTSFAAPHVSGAAALVISSHPDWEAKQVEQYLYDTSRDLGVKGKDQFYGFGLMQAPS